MSENTPLWQRYYVPNTGISFETYGAWTVERSVRSDGTIHLYQTIADTNGVLFVRYGKQETLKDFVPALKDLITTVTILEDQKALQCGQAAHRLKLLLERRAVGVYRMDEDEELSHEFEGATRTVILVTELVHNNLPILIGYRIGEESIALWERILGHFMQSLELGNI